MQRLLGAEVPCSKKGAVKLHSGGHLGTGIDCGQIHARGADGAEQTGGESVKREPNSHINERLHTGLAQSGRAAGMGISYDRYDDESGNPDYNPHDTRVRMPHDGLTDDKLAALSGAVRVTKGAANG